MGYLVLLFIVVENGFHPRFVWLSLVAGGLVVLIHVEIRLDVLCTAIVCMCILSPLL